MDKCSLCKTNSPDKENSHVIPLSILRNLVSKESGNLRDREASYTLSSLRNSSIYLGPQMTTPEKMTEIVGRVLTDEELSKQSNQFARDNFICTTCENRFSRLESLYSEKIAKKISAFRLSTKNTDVLADNGDAFYLFFISVLWRMSVTKWEKFAVSAQIEEDMRLMLHDLLNEDKKQLVSNITSAKDKIMKWPVCFGIADTSIKEVLNEVTYHPGNTTPYSLIVNEFILFLFPDEKTITQQPQTFFGLEKVISKESISYAGELRLSKVTAQDYNFAIDSINKNILQQYYNDSKMLFTDLYTKKKGIAPTDKLISDCQTFVWRKGIPPADFFNAEKVCIRILEFYNTNCLT